VKLCLVTGEFPPKQGGVGDYTWELGEAFASRGIEVHIVTSEVQGEPATRHSTSFVLHPVVQRWNWGCWKAISGVVHTVHADIVHLQYQAAAFAMHPAINLLPLRLRLTGPSRPASVVTFHDLRVPYLFPKAGPLRWGSVLALARASDAVVVTNGSDRTRLRQEGLEGHLIPIGSNIKPRLPETFERTAWRSRLHVGADDLLLCHFGFMNERKGIETLLLALRDLLQGELASRDPRLLMIGGKIGSSDPTNVAYLRHVEALIGDLGLEPYIRWTGYVSAEEVSASFAVADCCVLPYRDGVSYRHGTLMAALAHGLPIVTTTPANREGQVLPSEVLDGENLLLVPPDDPVALGLSIRRLARSAELQRRLRDGARKLSRLFDWDSIAARHLEVYRELA
jgi:glycosyltransferase involved in cell wall biosynthesis